MAISLKRTTFTTSRVLEFFSEKELNMQLGHHPRRWPLALLKELIDNALDAAELAGVAPKVTVTLMADRFSVQDNGSGLPVDTLERSLNCLVRVSDKSYYISPTRGQLGNALKCVWGAPFVADGSKGRVDVTTGGTRHEIAVTLDRIAQQPEIQHTQHRDGRVKTGTKVTVYWPGIASYQAEDAEDGFLQNDHHDDQIAGYEESEPPTDFLQMTDLVRRYALFNPHAAFVVKRPKAKLTRWAPTDTGWKHWLPNRPTSPHWYTAEHLRTLFAAYLSRDREHGRIRTVREVVAEFAGLSGTAKQQVVTTAAGCSKGMTLEDLVVGGDVAVEPVARLLEAMRDASRPVKAGALGIVGRDHLTMRLQACGVEEKSIRYAKASDIDDDGCPFVFETAYGTNPSRRDDGREIVVGLNWSPALDVPIAEIRSLLGEQRVDRWDPVTTIVHIAHPRFEWLDRGKSEVAV